MRSRCCATSFHSMLAATRGRDCTHCATPCTSSSVSVNDLARSANVEGLVTKSISGHLTDRMKDHYSTVSPAEQSEGIDRVVKLVASAQAPEQPADDGGMHRGMHEGERGMLDEKTG